jgi:hypothetical protein
MKTLLARCALLALVGAATLAASSPVAAQSSGRSCFWIRNIRNFASPDDRTVNVRVTGRDVFELQLFGRCPGVNWSHRAVLRSRSGTQICEGRLNNAAFYVRQAGGGRRQRCSVSNVRQLSANEIAALPPRARP